MKTMRGSLVFLFVFVLIFLPAVGLAQKEPQLAPEQQREFLLNARVISAVRLGDGVTHSYRLTLSDGELTHDAHFESINESQIFQELKGSDEINLVNSYRYNIAAYELAGLIGLDDMLPVTVERKWRGNTGSLSWWLPVQMDAGEGLKHNIRPPDIEAWNRSMYKVRVFAELIYDTNRSNPENILIGHDWKLYMVDFTRAFRPYDDFRNPKNLVRCSRELLDNLRKLNAAELQARAGKYLTKMEIGGIMQRRDKIVDHIEKLIEEKGEDTVLY